jgi:hypothetical protein
MFDTNKLPEFVFPLNLDVSQAKIIAQLKKYFAFKRSKIHDPIIQRQCVLPYNSECGLCSGLSAYWLYCKCARKESEFINKLEYFLNWHEDNNPNIVEDPKIEDFINAIEFLQFDANLRHGVKQTDIHESFELLLPEHYPQVNQAEFKTTFVFTKESLAKILDNTVLPNKMIMISNSYHAIGLVYSGDLYYLYDPQFKHGPKIYANPADLSEAILKSLGYFCKSKEYLAINLNAFDFKSRPKGRYPQIKDYFKSLTNNSNYKQALLKNQHIFDLAVWHKDDELANYLIQEGMDLNIRTPKGLIPLESAMLEDNFPMFYKLLAAGANPNLKTSQGMSLWDLAIRLKNNQALIMLAALCTDVSKNGFNYMISLGFANKRAVIEHAILLNKQLLNAQDILNINAANIQEIIAFLRHAKLKIQLGYDIDSIIIEKDDQQIIGIDALNNIAKFCQQLHSDGVSYVEQKKEIYELLNYLATTNFCFDYYKELLKNLTAIEDKINHKNITQYSHSDLLKLAMAIEQLYSLATHWNTLNPKKMYLCCRANIAKNYIEQYLANNELASIKEEITKLHDNANKRKHLLFMPRNQEEVAISYSKDIAPLLKIN